MLLSMTGFGEGRSEAKGCGCSVEVRAVNNRYLKTTTKLPDSHAALDNEVEKLVRDRIRRGTVSVFVRLAGRSVASLCRLNRAAIEAYLVQLKGLAPVDAPLLSAVLTLPGCVEEGGGTLDPQEDWPVIRVALEAALANLEKMRRDEGLAMKEELAQGCAATLRLVEQVERLAPAAVHAYRDRLRERIGALLADYGITIGAGELIKEVAIFAERADVAEEVARLKSHLLQFRETLESRESAGRKLEFLSQEMLRESNTIGSKANDVAIAQLVVELKSQVERIREIIQNVE